MLVVRVYNMMYNIEYNIGCHVEYNYSHKLINFHTNKQWYINYMLQSI